MRFPSATLVALIGAATAVSGEARAGLLSGLVLTPQAQALRTAISTGAAQFKPLMSGAGFTTLQSTLMTLLETLPGGVSVAVPVRAALTAAQLASSQADAAAIAAMQRCISDIIAKGGIPSGYVCVDSGNDTISAYQNAFNTYLEQFVGIVPPNVASAIQAQENAYFSKLGLIPPANDLNTQVNNAIISVIASTSGETVTAIERLEACFASATQTGSLQANNSCYSGPQSGLVSLNTLLAGVSQQFVGYLPPNVVLDLINIYNYYLSKPGVTPGLALQHSVEASILSLAASTSGNIVTLLQQASNCFSDLIMSSDPSSLPACIVAPGGPIFTFQVLLNSIIQQAFGYLPPTLVIELEQELAPYLAQADPDQEAIQQAFEAFFRAASLGPEFVTCVEALEDCLNEAVLGVSTACNLQGQCAALATP